MGYYESWKNPVLRELVPHMPKMFPKKVADCCLPKMTAAEVKESVRYLVDLGLLKKNKDGSYQDKLGRKWSRGQAIYLYKLDDEDAIIPTSGVECVIDSISDTPKGPQ